MRRALISGSILALILGTGCSSSSPRANEPGSPAGADPTSSELDALFGREKEVPPPREVRSPDESWTARFPSETEVELIRGQNHTQAHFSLGTSAKTRCFFYEQPIDAGQAIATILGSMSEKVTFEDLRAYRVQAAQGTPIVFVEGRYVTETSAGKQAGGLKLAVSPRHQIPVLCFLDEPGYKETFATAITELLSTFETSKPETPPSYIEIWDASLAGVPVGFSWLYVLDRGHGKRATISLSATFAPTGPGQLFISDELEALESDGKGVVKGTFVETANGQVSHELMLARSGKSHYRVTGKLDDKDFQAEFDAPKLSDDVTFYRFLLDGNADKLKTSEYSPSAHPAGPSDVTYTVDRKAKTVRVQVTDMSLLAKLHDSGLPSELSTGTGDQAFTQRVIHRTGQP